MKIAILGYGIEGESVYDHYRAQYPEATFVIYDNKPEPKNQLPGGVEFIGGVNDFKGITADIAIKTPAIAPWLIEVSGEVTTMTREFMKLCPAPIIGVTGSKGKGTTASFIQAILTAAGKKTWLVGNIGLGAFDVLDQIQPDDIVIYELSSFQLWDIDVSPHVAVVLGIEPEHLDVHKDMEDYVSAKANIAKYQNAGDIIIFNKSNEYAKSIAAQSLAERTPYPDTSTVHIRGGSFYYGEQEICSTSSVRLPGIHNKENACAAIAASWQWVKDGEVIARGLESFEGLPHRLKFVREFNSVQYYDDSIATTPGSAIAAAAAFSEPKIIILGGSSKGAEFTGLAERFVRDQSIRHLLLIGQEAPKLQHALEVVGMSNFTNLGGDITMSEIVAAAHERAQPGDVIVLSPACASFDMFKNYPDRGDQFIAAVKQLSN